MSVSFVERFIQEGRSGVDFPCEMKVFVRKWRPGVELPGLREVQVEGERQTWARMLDGRNIRLWEGEWVVYLEAGLVLAILMPDYFGKEM